MNSNRKACKASSELISIEYNTNEINSDEALQAFRLLFTEVREKGIGIDKVFDEIIDGYSSPRVT